MLDLLPTQNLDSNSFFIQNVRSTLKYKPAFFLKNLNCIKLFNLSHFEVETSLLSKNAKQIGVDFFRI